MQLFEKFGCVSWEECVSIDKRWVVSFAVHLLSLYCADLPRCLWPGRLMISLDAQALYSGGIDNYRVWSTSIESIRVSRW
jgi:hypothetical protein